MAKAKAIFIPGTNMIFPSGYAAAKALGINAGNINQVLRGKRQTAGGYRFGYAENRTIYVPQTGQTFSSPKAAARSLGVKTGRIYSSLEGTRPTKGKARYDFVYADKTTLQPASERVIATPPRKNNRKSNKQAQIQKKRQLKKEKLERRQQKQREIEQERERRKNATIESGAMKEYKIARAEVIKLLEKINDKLKEYYDVGESYGVGKNFLYYNQSAPAVLALQNFTGYSDDGYFDTSLINFTPTIDPNIKSQAAIEEIYTKTTQLLNNLKKRLEDETGKAKGRFWDITVAYGNRAVFALEFNISQVQMDEYAYLIWDMFDIFEQANEYKELGSDKVYNAVRDAMQGSIPSYKLQNFLEQISAYMENPYRQDLNEIFDILNGYEAPSAGIWDDDGWVI